MRVARRDGRADRRCHAVPDNGGRTRELTGGFAAFGYEVTGSTGLLVVYGIVFAAIGARGLSMLSPGRRPGGPRHLKHSQRGFVTVGGDRVGGSCPADRRPGWGGFVGNGATRHQGMSPRHAIGH